MVGPESQSLVHTALCTLVARTASPYVPAPHSTRPHTRIRRIPRAHHASAAHPSPPTVAVAAGEAWTGVGRAAA
jgi:hypothetical protein